MGRLDEENILMKTFKEQHRDLQFVIKNYIVLRAYNDQQGKNGTPDDAFLFAEASVLCVAFERFLRITPAMKAKDTETLGPLLDRAFAKNNPIFKPVHAAPIEDFKKAIRDIRNGVMHGNFEQLAKVYIGKGLISNLEEYFKLGFLTKDMEIIFQAFNRLISQVDTDTGAMIP